MLGRQQPTMPPQARCQHLGVLVSIVPLPVCDNSMQASTPTLTLCHVLYIHAHVQNDSDYVGDAANF